MSFAFAILQACMKNLLMICAKMQGDERVKESANRLEFIIVEWILAVIFVAA